MSVMSVKFKKFANFPNLIELGLFFNFLLKRTKVAILEVEMQRIEKSNTKDIIVKALKKKKIKKSRKCHP